MLQDNANDEAHLSWHHKKGWLLRTPMHVPDSVLLRMCQYAVGSQIKRYQAMAPDDPQKRLLEFAIGQLEMMRVTQIIIPAKVNTQKVAITA